MSFHTIIPVEALEEQPPVPQAVCLPCQYGFVSGVRDGEGKFVISQIISTDPAAYLDPHFAPGQFFAEPLTCPDSPPPGGQLSPEEAPGAVC